LLSVIIVRQVGQGRRRARKAARRPSLRKRRALRAAR
jgi:hypothetical protein